MESDAEISELRTKLEEAERRAASAENALDAARRNGDDASGDSSPFMRAAAEEVQRSEALMRGVFTGASDAMLLVDDEGRFVDANPAAAKLTGLPRAALLRKRVGSLCRSGDSHVSMARDQNGKRPPGGQFELERGGDLSIRVVDYRFSHDIGPGLHLAVLRDVTDERRANEALLATQAELRRSEARFRAMIEKSAEAIVVFSGEGRLSYVTRHSIEILGVTPEELVGKSAFAFIHPDDHEAVADAIARVVASPMASLRFEFRVRHSDGTIRWLEAVSTNLFEDVDVRGLVANIRDVTARHEAARDRDHLIATLQFERQRLGTLLQRAPAFMAVMRGSDLVFELVNEAYAAMVGDRELLGRRLAEAMPEFAEQGFVDMLQTVIETGVPFHGRGLPMRVVQPNGRSNTHYINVMLQALIEADGTTSGVLVHGVDVTEEWLAQKRIRAQFDGIPVPTFAFQCVDLATRAAFVLRDFNEAARKTFDGRLTDFVGQSAKLLWAGADHAVADLQRSLERGETFQREIEHAPALLGGAERRLLVTYAPAPPDLVLAHMEDVTTRRRLEEQLRQAQKMEAVGRLAGGIAHDFNNLLSVILSYVSLSIEDLAETDPMRADLEEIQRAGERAEDLTRQLLAFSRQQVLQPRPMSISATVLGLEKMLRRLVGEDVVLTLKADANAEILADPGQLEQVLMNLVINARDAMPEGGKLVLETSDVVLDEPLVTDHLTTPAGRYVLLCVSDTGAGMDASTQVRIFEPFFTTKGLGKGTGLGLATVFGILQQSGGNVQVKSTPGEGTTFRIYLPCGDCEDDRPPSSVQVFPRAGGNETILVAEDEDNVRGVVLTILRRAGYDVLEARNGAEGLKIAGQHEAPIHLLLTDVVMPHVSGRQLAEQVQITRPEIKILYMSGYTDDAVVLRRVHEAQAAFVQKPFTPDVLLRRIRETLDTSQA